MVLWGSRVPVREGLPFTEQCPATASRPALSPWCLLPDAGTGLKQPEADAVGAVPGTGWRCAG